jgi:hypothetical protein
MDEADVAPTALRVGAGRRNGPRIDYRLMLGKRPYEVYFACDRVALANDAESALSMQALAAMKMGQTLQVTERVSQRFVDNQRELMQVFRGWFPSYAQVDIQCEQPDESGEPRGERVGCFFTGGVDSFFTWLRHRDEVTDLVFVHGYDVDLDDLPRRAQISAMGRAIEEATGVRFIELETNSIRLFRDFGRWGLHAHGYGLGSAARHLAGYLGRIYVPSSFATEYMRPWGTHPQTDPLFSDERLDVCHGDALMRVDKIGEIAEDPLAMRYLRVCHERVEGTYNCARCEKCLRTMTVMQGLGVLHRCATFPPEVDPRWVLDLTLDEVTVGLARLNLEFLEAHGQGATPLAKAWSDLLARPAWQNAVVKRLRKWKGRLHKKLRKRGLLR